MHAPLPPFSLAEIAVALAGGIIGGFAAGFLWAAQGTYFAANAKNYAYHMNVSIGEANGTLASVFAAIFLGFEVSRVAMPPSRSTK